MAKMSPELARALFDYEPDTGLLRWKRRQGTKPAGSIAGTKSKLGYIRVMYQQQSYMAHCIAWAVHSGEWASAPVEHADCVLDNNRIANLRLGRRGGKRGPPITQARLKQLLEYDEATGIFRWLVPWRNVPVGAVAGAVAKNGYVVICVEGVRRYAHRLAWLYVHGVWPSMVIDHRNRAKTDNAISNLRDIPTSHNVRRAASWSHNTSGLRGISWCRRRRAWRTYFTADGRHVHVGYFSDKSAAKVALGEAMRGIRCD